MGYTENVKQKLSAVNSTSTPLNTGTTFTGTGELNSFEDVMVTIATDQDGTLYMEFSPDGTNWDSSLIFYYNTARINPPHILVKGYRYYRTRFTNTSASNQTYLRLDTFFGAFNKLTAPINGTLAENYDAIVTRPNDYIHEVTMGKRQGRTAWQKFGYNSDVDAASPEIIASFGGAFNPTTAVLTSAQTFTITYDGTGGGSTDGAGTTGATQLLFYYIDSNYKAATGIHTLETDGSDVTSFTGFGINRVVVYANGGLGWNANDITITGTTSGTIQALIPSLDSVTQQCLFHTQINHNFLLKGIYVNVLKLTKGGNASRVIIKIYSWSRVTNTRYEVFKKTFDTDSINILEFNFQVPLVFGGREVIYMEATTDVDNTSVAGRFIGIEERIS